MQSHDMPGKLQTSRPGRGIGDGRAGRIQTEAEDQPQAGPFQIPIRQLGHAGTADDDNVVAAEHLIHLSVENCPQTPLDPIARDRVAHPFADHKAKAAVGQVIGQTAQHQVLTAPAPARPTDPGESGGVLQAVPPFHHPTCGAAWRLVDGLAVGQLDADAMAAAQTAPLEHIAAARALHALAETMGAQSLPYFGLPGSLGHSAYTDIMQTEPTQQARSIKDKQEL